jgi:hypothetical protein
MAERLSKANALFAVRGCTKSSASKLRIERIPRPLARFSLSRSNLSGTGRILMKKKWLIFTLFLSFLLSACNLFNFISPSGSTHNPTPTTTSVTPLAPTENWDDQKIFQSGLISSEQPALESLKQASVYHLDIEIADDFLSLHGQEKVRYTNQENQSLNEVYFQLFPNMEGGKSTVSDAMIDDVTIKPIYEEGNSTMRVPLSTPLESGHSVVIQLNFEVNIPQDAGGNYGLFGYIDDILVLDGFYPAIPVFDENGWHKGIIPPNSDTTFQDVSFYVVKVTAPKNLVIVTTGVQVDSQQSGNQQIKKFAQGPARDFYIAASKDFKVVSEKIGETTVNSYAANNLTDGSKIALKTAVNAIKDYNANFGTYPYTEFDVVSTPMQGAYGIEYPGITGINYSLYDLNSIIGGLSASVTLESTVAHETAHQWFYNVVGDDQWNQPWLDESMAQYSTGLYYLDEYGQQGFDGYESSWYSRWDRVDREIMPIGLPAGDYQGKEYSAIVYGRGPIFIETLAKTMGQPAFTKFLKDYYQTYKWGIATTSGYEKLAETECQCDLTTLFSDWVTGK